MTSKKTFIKVYFNEHPKLSYLGNLTITFLGIFVFPLIFMPNFIGFIIGSISSTIIINFLGLKWIALIKLKNKKQ